jgi:putative ABC transport system permease protein
MSADVLGIMTLVGLLIALAVVGLSLFTLTLANLRDYGVLKALGARNRRLAATIAGQAGWSIGAALVLAVALTWALGVGVARVSPTIRIVIEPASVLRAGVGALAVGALGAVIPLRRIWHVDPAAVFRRPS